MPNQNPMSIKDKMHVILAKLDFYSLSDFAQKVTNGNYDRAKGLNSGRIKNFNKKEIHILIQNYNLNREWLLFDSDDFYGKKSESNKSNRIMNLPLLNEPEECLYFDKFFLRDITHIENCFCFIMDNDAMSKTIEIEDVVIFEKTKNRESFEIKDGLYLFRLNNNFFVRRVTHSIADEGLVNLSCDNNYPTESFELKKLPEIVGRLVKVFKSTKF